MTIGENVEIQVDKYLKKRSWRRHGVIQWMKRNNLWYQEIVAKEWERRTGEFWMDLFKDAIA
jgi:hypothetical protein